MSERLLIRPVRQDERADWEPLWAGYLKFYKATVAPFTTMPSRCMCLVPMWMAD
jgi:hypothetical protein